MYQAQNLPPGTYTLNASQSQAFKNLMATNLKVRPGLRSKFNANLDQRALVSKKLLR